MIALSPQLRVAIALLAVTALGASGCSGSNGGAASSSSGATSSGATSSSGGTDGGAGTDGATASDAGSSGGSNDAAIPPGSTALTGTLGTLGAVQPTVSSLWISNSGESLVYLSSAPITCDTLKTSRWLGGTKAGSQVVELVILGAPKLSDYPVPPSEVNYAPGAMSSSHEVGAQSGKITFTKAEVGGTVEGSFSAKYANGGNVAGTFSATFCANGQGY